jgi:hypothetical protein
MYDFTGRTTPTLPATSTNGAVWQRGRTALPDVIRCAQAPACVYTQASFGIGMDDVTVASLRDYGWQVVDGAWTCPDHLPGDRQRVPGAMGRPLNPHCAVCGDTRGGAYGHEAFECTMRESPAP